MGWRGGIGVVGFLILFLNLWMFWFMFFISLGSFLVLNRRVIMIRIRIILNGLSDMEFF